MALNPVSFNALAVIKAALGDIGAVSLEEDETVTSAMGQDAFNRLQALISSWSIHNLAIPFVEREVFAVTANQSTYTIGPGGDFDTIRPNVLTGAGLLLKTSTPYVEIPRAVLTDDAYQAIQVKDLTNVLWTSVYYNTTFTSNLGRIFLWPTPNTATNDLVLYRGDQVQGFTNLTSAQSFPPGYFEAMEYNLALRLSIPYGQPATPDLKEMAAVSFAALKRQNIKPADATLDPAMTKERRFGYNILTGTGG